MNKRPLILPFDPAGIVLDRRRGLSQQLYQALRARVLDGRLSSGTRLPASRDLAAILALSRNSVVRAYDQLYAEGYIESRVGDGTYVIQLEKLSTQLSTGLSLGLSTGLSTFSLENAEDLSSSERSSEALERLKSNHLPVPRSGAPRAFRVGIPAFDLFPFDVWAKLQAAFWRNPDPAQLGYGDPAGELQLRELIAAYLRRSRGLSCTAEQIVITSGAQQAISLCAQLLLQPGEGVAVENPGYRAAGHTFAVAGGKVMGVPVDEEGMDCERLVQLTDCRLAYVTPAHQYPTGVTMSLARRLALLAWAERNDGWIIEDDYDGEYRYSGAPLAPLAALDRQGRVLYVGTFGKIAFPALRLGYLVLPARLVQAFSQGRALAMRHSEVGSQCVMAEFMAQGHFQRHIRRMRRAALSRRNVLKAGWPLDVPGLGGMPEVAAGLHVKVDVDNFAREQELVATAEAVGVEVNPLSSYWLEDSQVAVDNRAGLVLGFAAVPEADIANALMRLRRAWKK
ncbi:MULTISPECIES: PLP-dependent aminotransferase family protein [Pseudomonas]|uniref:PLP-dependent aminotransferase family protein n=1 Tax=Pseudomonas capeferrum TaxID=1495066 RepID=A0ABY7RAJ7_9PSED|nr:MULTISPECIES: PLP-dependent aminotransferase family protein [Pseudomonas]KGI93717.1 GntR family transcriptional regulator [Pseudomonas sp. H2]MUT49342.1 aminotransferase class I/II-fold pyridoxal phosphate-dependent enzyme [Pseudomonas sp. TDA1]UVL03894.1 PLP-dependent aminotransferase family protein [Pseudomonas sp. B21-047]WCI00234.1 PLP-dependent aminotransferase family protein [Pseudomonas capeferrum]